MPIILNKVDHERREVDALATGPITYAEIEHHLLEERNFGGLAYKEFVDARDAALVFAAYPAQIRQIVGLIRNMGQQSTLGPSAVFVSTDFSFGVFTCLEVLVQDVAEIKPFRDESEARAWLDSKSAQ
jgi:hypothetical protein